MLNQKNINVLTIFILALIFIHIAGICLYKHEHTDIRHKNPIYLAMGFGFAGLGGSILLSLLEARLLPKPLREEILMLRNITAKK